MRDHSESIACIGWGSLVWDPRELPIEGSWYHDGPVLPVEFARHSGAARGEDKLTLVLLSSGSDVTTRWAKLNVTGLDDAREKLRAREGCVLGDIGYWPGGVASEFAEKIAEWARGMSLKGVVWTALPAKFAGDDHRVPTKAEALSFLSGLAEKPSQLAEEYVRKAPLAVQTPYRTAFEEKLGGSRCRKIDADFLRFDANERK